MYAIRSYYVLGLRRAEHIARSGQQDHDLVAPEHEPGQPVVPQPRARGALDHPEGGGDQAGAAKGSYNFV